MIYGVMRVMPAKEVNVELENILPGDILANRFAVEQKREESDDT